MHLADVAKRLGGAAREGCFSTASRVRGLPKVHEVNEARLKHRLYVTIERQGLTESYPGPRQGRRCNAGAAGSGASGGVALQAAQRSVPGQ